MPRAILAVAAAIAAGVPATAIAVPHDPHPHPPSPSIRTGPAITYDAQAVTRVRQSVTSLTQDQKDRLVRAILQLKATPSPWDARFSWYDNFVWWHRKAFACQVDQAHMRPAFLPWHRQYLFMFESALQQVSGDSSITVPYWDWTDPRARAAIFTPSFMGPNGDRNQDHAVLRGPFRRGKWVLTVRDPKQNDPLQYTFLSRNLGSWPGVRTLPTVAQVNAALAAPRYDAAPFDLTSNSRRSFRNNIEGWRGFAGMSCSKGLMQPRKIKGNTQPNQLHNAVHLWVGGAAGPPDDNAGGTMTLNTSPNDPVFWLHHANIDRLWDTWERRHGAQYVPATSPVPGQGIDSPMWPWRQSGYFVSPRSVLQISPMGYAYEEAPAARGQG
jgi:tyrosinase